MDRGIATAGNSDGLKNTAKAICASAGNARATWTRRPRSASAPRGGDTVRLLRELSADRQEVRRHGHSVGRELQETGILKRFGPRFEKGLAKLAAGLDSARRVAKSV